MMNGSSYTLGLKKKQLSLLEQYSELVEQALEGFKSPQLTFLRSFQEQEKAYLHKLEHLHRVIKAFPEQGDRYVDQDLINTYNRLQERLDLLMEIVREKKKGLSLREKHFLLKSNRQKRLYREIKPAYIDIRT